MHVAVDARLARSAGHRTYITNLVPRMARLAPDWRFTLLGGAGLAADPWTKGDNLRVSRCDASLYGAREQVEIPRLARGADLIWTPHYNVPLFARAPVVATVHDCAHLRLQEYAGNFLKRTYARTMFAAVQRRAAAVIFISEFTRREFAELAGDPRSTWRVIHEGVDAAWFAREASMPPQAEPYFLFVGNLKPHKNLGRLIEAFSRIRGDIGHNLVIIGRIDGMITVSNPLESLPGYGAHVKHVADADDAMLRRYVQHATALVFPSLYEGFGLPPLEAMAAGTPVIASRAASIPEVCGDAALLVDPLDTAALADAMRRVASIEGLRRDLAAKGAIRARAFRWDDAAAKTLEVLRAARR